jgi:hypothetical protein
VSCDKTSYISSFERFVNSVAENQESYTAEDWEQADLEFENFIDSEYVKYQAKLTQEENQKIGKLKGKYLAIRAKSEADNFMNSLKNSFEQLDGMIEGFVEEFDTTETQN